MSKEVEHHCSNSIKDAKDLIKQLTSRLVLKEQENLAPSEAEFADRVHKLGVENATIASDIDDLCAVIENKNKNIIRLQTEIIACSKEEITLPPVLQQEDSRTTYALSLYSKISNISWNYTESNGILEGYVGSDQSQQVTPFQIDTQSLTDFETANQLWNLIGSASDAEYEML
eukprot:CAMPEP_0182429294 /NCGR_PEP_ID=MMETSP1167-20130531/25663_1 /TAXON_ID=2988 /ORGANISM="Mallomonas Sp, Strain CCMP3275" /LENGTH=172 /DNA_ID=CAMNT_0024612729 /DNA_START=171 /DNA_END=689 /DNA_ORIENTATION=+